MTVKRKYEKPSMEVIECEQELQLLADSTTGQMDDPEDYELTEDPFAF